jgi:hypothetical protein
MIWDLGANSELTEPFYSKTLANIVDINITALKRQIIILGPVSPFCSLDSPPSVLHAIIFRLDSMDIAVVLL